MSRRTTSNGSVAWLAGFDEEAAELVAAARAVLGWQNLPDPEELATWRRRWRRLEQDVAATAYDMAFEQKQQASRDLQEECGRGVPTPAARAALAALGERVESYRRTTP